MPLIFIIAIPFLIILSVSLLNKKAGWPAAILASGLACWPIMFFFLRHFGSWFGGADFGFGFIMVYSPVLTIPMALAGLYFGRNISVKTSLICALIALTVWAALSLYYNSMVSAREHDFRQRSELDCTQRPYHCAVRDKRHEKLALIHAQGADIEARDGWERTPLIYALGDRKATKILLELGANPNVQDSNGFTPLALVLRRSPPDIEMAALLLEHGADIHKIFGNDRGNTLLNYAVSKRYDRVIDFLLENGADPHVESGYGYTACQIVRSDEIITERLTKACAR